MSSIANSAAAVSSKPRKISLFTVSNNALSRLYYSTVKTDKISEILADGKSSSL